MSIIDVRVFFAEIDYHVNEAWGSLLVSVIKPERIASPITLKVSPVTVAEALASGAHPGIIPPYNPLSPNRAGELLNTSAIIILI
jgi:hypothetical protein